MAGPRTGYRNFDGKVFALASIHSGQTNAVHGKGRATASALHLRKLGVNARVIQGVGWSAVYVGMQPKPQISNKQPTVKSARTKRKGAFTKASILPPITWTPDKATDTTIKKPNQNPPSEMKTKLMKGMSTLMWKEMNYFQKKGLGRMYPVYEVKDNSTVTDFQTINLSSTEGKELLLGLTETQGLNSFKSWLQSAGRNKETTWKGHPDLGKYHDALQAGKEQDLDVFVIYIDENPAFWSPLSSKFAQEVSDSAKPKEFKGWAKFSPNGRPNGAV